MFDKAQDPLPEIRHHSSEVDKMQKSIVRFPGKSMRLSERTKRYYEEDSESHASRPPRCNGWYRLVYLPGKMVHRECYLQLLDY